MTYKTAALVVNTSSDYILYVQASLVSWLWTILLTLSACAEGYSTQLGLSFCLLRAPLFQETSESLKFSLNDD